MIQYESFYSGLWVKSIKLNVKEHRSLVHTCGLKHSSEFKLQVQVVIAFQLVVPKLEQLENYQPPDQLLVLMNFI